MDNTTTPAQVTMLWSDNDIITRYRETFGVFAGVHRLAFIRWIRDDLNADRQRLADELAERDRRIAKYAAMDLYRRVPLNDEGETDEGVHAVGVHPLRWRALASIDPPEPTHAFVRVDGEELGKYEEDEDE